MIQAPLLTYRLLFLGLALLFQSAAAQVAITPGQTIERELASDGSDAYTLDLEADRFVVGRVFQHSADVVVAITGAEGESIGRIDRSARGPEIFHFTTTDPGVYTLTLTPFEEEEGRYGLTVDRVEPVATTPEGEVDQLFAKFSHESSPGGVVGVVRGGELVFADGYGLADMEHGVLNTPSTPYYMASVSKQFTAFAIALLADQGRLSLDDDVRQHLPEVPDFGPTLTLRHLVTHTSGLRDHLSLWGLAGGLMDDVIRQEDLMRLVERQRELNFEPGSQFSYSNTGYLLLAEVVSRVTGESFGEWMGANVFRPLGMDHTQIYDDHERLVPGRAYSYAHEPFGVKKMVMSFAASGSGNLIATVEDLAHWLRNFRTAEVGGPAVARQMLERGVLTNGDTLTYAFGLVVDEYRGLRRIQHSGVSAGFRTMLAYYPEIDAGVVAMLNAAAFNAPGIVMAVSDAFFGESMDEVESAVVPAAPEPAAESPAEEPEPVVVPPALLDAYAGDYRIVNGPPVTITRTEGGLTSRLGGQPAYPLVAISDTLFRVVAPNATSRVSFHVGPDGEVMGGLVLQGAARIPFQRSIDWNPSPEFLAAYAGRYYSPELETEYTARVDGDRLVLVHRRHGEIPLSPENEDVFRSDTWYLGNLEFERDAAGSVTGMRSSSGRVQDLRFKKQN